MGSYAMGSYAMTRSYSDDPSIGVSKAPTMLNNRRSKPYRAAWRPTLDEVLNNTTPSPYTLSAFIQYLSQTHCLETLDFILEAKRYCESYKSLFEPAGESIVTLNSSAIIHLSMLYQLLLTTFILPGAAREVNLSVDIRDALLRHKNMSTPPLPETLDSAVKSIYALIEDSIFVSFLNSPPTLLHRDPTTSDQNDIRSYLSCMISEDNQPTKPVQTKRSSLKPFGRTLSWPPWSR